MSRKVFGESMKNKSLFDIVAELIDAAHKQDEAVMAGDGKAARKYGNLLCDRWSEVKDLGNEAKDELAKHLRHPDPSVRSTVAVFLLKHRHDEAMSVLNELAQGEGLGAFECQEAIKRWEEGNWSLE
jgi:hypothetical protein